MFTGTDQTEQFKQSFREEAQELVTELETALLELNESPGNLEIISRIFRALHTIKGSGAMFGFEKLAAFTHNLENAYDEVRNGKLVCTEELIDLTLEALDQISEMLREVETPESIEKRSIILAHVKNLSNTKDAPGERELARAVQTATETANEEAAQVGDIPDSGTATYEEWLIRFAPGPEMLLNGSSPLLLLRELKLLGEINLQADLDALPPLAEIDPERCYASWHLKLRTNAGRDAIRDVFLFVEDSADLQIVPAHPKDELATPLAADLPEKEVTLKQPVNDADRTALGLEDQRVKGGGRRFYDKPDNASSLRVPAAKLDKFVDLVGELVTVQARLSEIAVRHDIPDISEVSEEIERLSAALRENSMNIRMVPIRSTFEKFRRLVHDLARDLDKAVELTIEGAETELDKTVIEQLGDPLMHLIRNSMDHGIESTDERKESGKAATSHIQLSARYAGANVLISVSDDGRGINREAVYRRAIERGLIASGAELTEQQTFALIFESGFSTAKQVTDLSGRGVGMDVVRQKVESLRGTIEIQSKPGQGTTVILRLPLTLAIIDGLLVNIGDASFVLPLASTLECIELTREDVERANGKHLVNVRDELVPYIRLRELFGIESNPPAIEQIMLVETAEGRFGFVVDQVLGDCQTVIKNLGRLYRHVQFVSGATILGNGSVALILDPDRLAQNVVRSVMQSKSAASEMLSRVRERLPSQTVASG